MVSFLQRLSTDYVIQNTYFKTYTGHFVNCPANYVSDKQSPYRSNREPGRVREAETVQTAG